MENTDIDMVISIPDTPDRPVRRESNKRPRSPEAPGRFQRGEHRHHPNGRARPASDTQAEHGHGHRSRASGSNALFRRTAVEKDKGKSICIDQRNGHPNALFTSEGVRESRPSDDGSSANKGKGIVVECGSVSNRERIDLSSERKPVRGTRRLVRNGCISPHAIAARTRQAAADDTNSKDRVSLEQELALEAASSIDIREIVSDNHSRGRSRGKRPEIPSSRVASREASEGWVSTRSRSLNIDHEVDRRDESDTRGACSFVSGLDVLESGAVDREARPQRRRKNGVTPSRYEPQASVIGSSGEPSSSRPRNYQRQGRQVLEIEDSSPEVRVSRAPRRVENDESDDVKARQIEADALMARELQEQMYAESTIRNEQMDETIARMMEQEENSRRPSSRASTRNTRSSNTIAADPGGSSLVEERPQQHSSRRRMNPPQARAAVRAPRRPAPHLGRAHASRHGPMHFNFPSGMDVELRMDFLENLENVIGHSFNNSNLLHMDRDFTEDDYELLLALDENNHQHGGASTSRINNLPESTVQTDNFEETCVICLETPTIGDTIRHLPCFHKFHKDCIDPWLGRSKACPVCKFSVT
ncbi:zinc finger CCCH domain-containing protein 13 [Brassica rapa]|uniref:RING-type domain-containing protein n=1 Tax=Brassica campestris TaxID=3711 RepID=M4DFS6_BRACM|nr:zinc finger CCCH domain-containing protein 13 [Brassica rapa]XP_018511199.1 zinc finger CCCH domain-containing protein 13 [Brassica rapa]